MKMAIMSVALLVLTFSLGCQLDDSGVDIRGQITSVTVSESKGSNAESLGVVLIEGELQDDTEFDKALVRITDSTTILRRVGSETKSSSFESLAEGQLVEAKFIGPVLESYPVQTEAATVVILSDERN